MILAWENRDGGVSVTRVVDDTRHAEVLAALIADGHLANPASVLVEPALPDAPRHQWRIQNGRIVVDVMAPAPVDPRAALRAEIQSATTVAALKAALLRLLDGR